MDTLPSLEVKHAHARLELRERQLQELAGTMSELSTEEVWMFLLKKVFCFVCLFCLQSSLLSLTEIQHNAHVLRVKMEVSFASFAWWHTTDPCLTKTFALFLRFIASWMFHAVCMCYMFASMNNGYIVYHAFHGLHIILRFKLFLFLCSLLTVPWNTMYNKAILVFSLYCRSWSKTTRRKPSVPHKQLKNIATKPCLKWRRRSTE